MASIPRCLCRSFRQISRSIPSKAKPIQNAYPFPSRPFSVVTSKRDAQPSRTPTSRPVAVAEEEEIGEGLDESEYLTPQKPYTIADLSPVERADYELLSREDQKQYIRLQNHFKAIFESQETDDELDALVDQADQEIERDGGADVKLEFPNRRPKGPELGFWGDGEEDELAQTEDADNDHSGEHITTVAESQLDLHKDIREYTRIIAWDLPLLQQYAKPFQVPNHSTPLRFRYTTYMGETHPAQNKVTVEFCSKDLLQNPQAQYKISEAQRMKFLKLVGVRYNPQTDVIKITSEKFETPAQNKRYLGELIGKLIKEAKDKRDMLEDIPLDLRHHKPKKAPQYPEEWKLKSKTIQKVLEARQEMKLLGGGDEVIPIDGKIVVEQYIRAGSVMPSRVLPR